ncbi:MAG: phytanoyl-CoA dioxygenase [Alphaproteobacteria bacterium]|nr:phytanoyl-CoA dioxygenase [Alphaproteobacteria bacterium]
MVNYLSDAARRQYQDDGYYFPARAINPEEAARYRGKLEAFEASQGGKIAGRMRQKLHLLLTWMDELVRHPAILDAVESVLGPDILCWQTSFFIKDAKDAGFVTWHQDSTYWGLSKPDVATAWLALSRSSLESGAMRVLPGTHKWDQLAHTDSFDKKNLLTRGQQVDADIDDSKAVDLILQPGEFSLHHVRLVHASEPNQSEDRRIGLAIRYVAPHVHQATSVPDSALLVRGEDAYGHFEAERSPAADMHPDAVAQHALITERREGFLYAGTDKRSAN